MIDEKKFDDEKKKMKNKYDHEKEGHNEKDEKGSQNDGNKVK